MRLKRLLQDPFMVVWAKKLTVAWSSKVSMHFDGKMCRYVPYKSIVVNCPSGVNLSLIRCFKKRSSFHSLADPDDDATCTCQGREEPQHNPE